MDFGFAHGAFEAEQQPIVEERGVIEPIAVADQGVGEAAQIEQAVPLGVVAGEPGNLDAEQDADVAEGHLGGQVGEAGSVHNAGCRQPQVVLHELDLVAAPAEFDGAIDESVLAAGRFGVAFELAGG
jgi:hypothetical protein